MDYRANPTFQTRIGWNNTGINSFSLFISFINYLIDVFGGRGKGRSGRTAKRNDKVLEAFPDFEEANYETAAIMWEAADAILANLPAGAAGLKYQKAFGAHFSQYLLVPLE